VPLEDGKLQIDNNQCENAIRPTKLGAKNWMFVGAEGTGWISAVLYTIVENCRHHGLEPRAYLKDLLERLPGMKSHQVASLTPLALSRAHRESREIDLSS
jgi:hypothetical protein